MTTIAPDLTRNTVRESGGGGRMLPAIDPATGRIDPAHVPPLGLVDPAYSLLAAAVTPSAVISMFSHFVEQPGANPLGDASSNGGNSNFLQQHNDQNHIGVAALSTGGGNGIGAIVTTSGQLYLGFGVTTLDVVFQIPTLSTGGDTFEVRAGGMTSAASGTPNDGLYVRYTHGTNGGRYQLVAVNNGVATAVDAGLAASAGAWVHAQITASADGSSATVSFDGGQTIAATVTGLPLGQFRTWCLGVAIEKSAGTNSRSVLVDFAGVRIALTTPL